MRRISTSRCVFGGPAPTYFCDSGCAGPPLGGGPRGHVAAYRDGVRRFVAVTTPQGEATADVVERLVGSVEWVGTDAQREAAWRASH